MDDIDIHITSDGYPVMVDPQDSHLLLGKRSRSYRGGHVRYVGVRANGRKRGVPLHQLIMRPPPCFVVDHINRDGLDNRRCNLRLATKAQNGANRKLNSNSTSGAKGVVWATNKGKWRVLVGLNGKKHHGGYFESVAEAHERARSLRRQLHQDFARDR